MNSMRLGLTTALLAADLLCGQTGCPALASSARFSHDEIGEISIFKAGAAAGSALLFTSQMQVNTDGAPDAYHPDDSGTTHICNALSVAPPGKPCANAVWKPDCLADYRKARAQDFTGEPKACFFAAVTEPGGKPVVQHSGDPNPGFFISTTALTHPGKDRRRPEGQLDSNLIPFIVLPRQSSATLPGLALGDVAAVFRKSTNSLEMAVVGDVGPKKKLGEGSIALHRALGNDPFVVRNGVRRARRGIGGRDVLFVVFPGSRSDMTSFSAEAIRAEGRRRLEAFGGETAIRDCATKVR